MSSFNSINTMIKISHIVVIYLWTVYTQNELKNFLETFQGEERNVRENLTRDDSFSFGMSCNPLWGYHRPMK